MNYPDYQDSLPQTSLPAYPLLHLHTLLTHLHRLLPAASLSHQLLSLTSLLCHATRTPLSTHPITLQLLS